MILIRALYAGRTWRSASSVLLGLPMAYAGFLLLTVTLATAMLVVTAPAAVLGLFRGGRVLSGWQRERFAALLGAALPPPVDAPEPPEGYWARWRAQVADPVALRELLYHWLVNPALASVTAPLVVASWGAGIGFTATGLYAATDPERGLYVPLEPRGFGLTAQLVMGAALLIAAPWISRGLARLELAAARTFLQPTSAQLRRRIDVLTRSRAQVVAATDAERRRIERDLHDGAQQRLVSLAMNLGASRAALKDATGPEREAIVAAHEEAKLALAELRDFVRGLHPAVLEDRGLDAALSGLAASCPVPVTVDVRVDRRCSPTVEAVAYFVVSESLTNVAKHAKATAVALTVTRAAGPGIAADRLVITIEDNGDGGADPARGTGLRGLADRVASVDGTLDVSSPPGGPTRISAELPCES